MMLVAGPRVYTVAKKAPKECQMAPSRAPGCYVGTIRVPNGTFARILGATATVNGAILYYIRLS